jgi:hypothetical protein
MNVSMPSEVRHLVKQAAISTAALERNGVDDSAWIVRAVCEKLQREWEVLGLDEEFRELATSFADNGLEGRRWASGRGQPAAIAVFA